MSSYFDKLKGKYTKEHLIQMELIEKQFYFESFSSNDALDLGILTAKIAKEEFQSDVVILITREKDQNVIFQYIMDEKSQRNIDFANMKRNATLKTGHNSLWVLMNGLINDESLLQDTSYIPVGGAWPIYIGNELVGTIAVSGLKAGKDYTLLEMAISRYLHIDINPFEGITI